MINLRALCVWALCVCALEQGLDVKRKDSPSLYSRFHLCHQVIEREWLAKK